MNFVYRCQIARAARGIAPTVRSESGVVERCINDDLCRRSDVTVRTDQRNEVRAQQKTPSAYIIYSLFKGANVAQAGADRNIWCPAATAIHVFLLDCQVAERSGLQATKITRGLDLSLAFFAFPGVHTRREINRLHTARGCRGRVGGYCRSIRQDLDLHLFVADKDKEKIQI